MFLDDTGKEIANELEELAGVISGSDPGPTRINTHDNDQKILDTTGQLILTKLKKLREAVRESGGGSGGGGGGGEEIPAARFATREEIDQLFEQEGEG